MMRLRETLAISCLVLVMGLGIRSAFADGDAPKNGEAEHAASDHGDGGHGAEKPALLQWDFGTAFWSVIVFAVLLVVLRATAWKPILQGLNQREAFIRDSIESARKEREEAKRLLDDYTAKLHKAREEATVLVEEGRRDAEEVRKGLAAEAKKEADAIVARAKKEIEMARDDAVKKLYDQTIMLATNVAGKIVRKDMSGGDHKRLLDESLADLGRMNN
jgi:F-type H+-transporting ATPase subunit b